MGLLVAGFREGFGIKSAAMRQRAGTEAKPLAYLGRLLQLPANANNWQVNYAYRSDGISG